MSIEEVPEPVVETDCYAPNFEFGTRWSYKWPELTVEFLACPNGKEPRAAQLISAKQAYIRQAGATLLRIPRPL
jgi:hypothetical protein